MIFGRIHCSRKRLFNTRGHLTSSILGFSSPRVEGSLWHSTYNGDLLYPMEHVLRSTPCNSINIMSSYVKECSFPKLTFENSATDVSRIVNFQRCTKPVTHNGHHHVKINSSCQNKFIMSK